MTSAKPRLVVIGARGQIGSALMAQARERYDVTGVGRPELDITEHAGTAQELTELAPEVIVNTAALHQVDACEDRVDEAFRANASAVLNLAQVSERLGALLVHVSTDYVFGGDASHATPYAEDELPAPLNVYGASKLAGEQLARAYSPGAVVVRTSAVFGTRAGSGSLPNFIEFLRRRAESGEPLEIVNDQRSSPTFAGDLAAAILNLAQRRAPGLFHVTNSGNCTRYELATELFRLLGATPKLSPITAARWNARARRPSYSVLENQRYQEAGFAPLRSWQHALAAYLAPERKK